jgi:mRNA-degrading endonuclease RelE of RelBE toxin-antitoxin system
VKLPLKVDFARRAAKDLRLLDTTTRKRIVDKLDLVAADPLNPVNSYPLEGTDKRSARVGGYRIVLVIDGETLLVLFIESRGQVYRRI